MLYNGFIYGSLGLKISKAACFQHKWCYIFLPYYWSINKFNIKNFDMLNKKPNISITFSCWSKLMKSPKKFLLLTTQYLEIRIPNLFLTNMLHQVCKKALSLWTICAIQMYLRLCNFESINVFWTHETYSARMKIVSDCNNLHRFCTESPWMAFY